MNVFLPAPLKPVREGASGLLSGIMNLVLPPLCALCRDPLVSGHKHGLCLECREAIAPPLRPSCPGCGSAPTAGPTDFCPLCRGVFHRDGVIALGSFDGGLKELVHSLKYGADLPAGRCLADLMASRIRRELPGGCDAIIPVPLHRRRLRARGFNQAAWLSRWIARQTGWPLLARALVRIAHTRPLAGLDRRERKKEVRGVIRMRRSVLVEGKRVLLVDDVFTSGATAEECCRVLKEKGASSVVCATAGRA